MYILKCLRTHTYVHSYVIYHVISHICTFLHHTITHTHTITNHKSHIPANTSLLTHILCISIKRHADKVENLTQDFASGVLLADLLDVLSHGKMYKQVIHIHTHTPLCIWTHIDIHTCMQIDIHTCMQIDTQPPYVYTY